MASFEREIVEKYQEVARAICDFLYVDGRSRNGFRQHAEEEYQSFLKELADESFETFNEGAKYMGWIE